MAWGIFFAAISLFGMFVLMMADANATVDPTAANEAETQSDATEWKKAA